MINCNKETLKQKTNQSIKFRANSSKLRVLLTIILGNISNFFNIWKIQISKVLQMLKILSKIIIKHTLNPYLNHIFILKFTLIIHRLINIMVKESNLIISIYWISSSINCVLLEEIPNRTYTKNIENSSSV